MSSVQSEAQDVENRVGDVRTIHTEAGRNQKRADGVQTVPSADGPNTVTGGALMLSGFMQVHVTHNHGAVPRTPGSCQRKVPIRER